MMQRTQNGDETMTKIQELENTLEEVKEDMLDARTGYMRGEVSYTEIARLNGRKTATELALRDAYRAGHVPFCPACLEKGESKGHMTCPFPND
jgi:hypothetical protein